MELSSTIVRIILFLQYYAIARKCHSDMITPGDVYVIGLFPLHSNETSYEEQSILTATALKYFIEQYNTPNKTITVGYIIHGNCDDEATTIKTYLQQLMDHSKFKLRNISNVIGVVGMFPKKKDEKIILNIIAAHHVPFFNFVHDTLEDEPPSNISLRRVYSRDTLSINAIKEAIIHYNWEYVTVLFSNEYIVNQKQFWTLTQRRNVCVSSIPIINGTLIADAELFLGQDNKSNIVVLLSDFEEAELFFKKADEKQWHGKTFLGNSEWTDKLIQLSTNQNATYRVIRMSNIDYCLKPFSNFVKNMTFERANATNNTWLMQYIERKGSMPVFAEADISSAVSVAQANLYGMSEYGDTLTNVSSLVEHIEAVKKYNLDLFHQEVGLTITVYSNDRNLTEHDVMTSSSLLNTTWYERLPWSEYDGNTTVTSTAECNQTCTVGYGARHVEWESILKNPRQIYKSWECEKCSKGFRTPCENFENDGLNFTDTAGYITLTLAVFGVCVVLSVVVIFSHFRNTPFIRASNRNMSVIQLVAHMLLFLAPLMFFVKPSEELCTARPIVLGILLTFIMAVTLMKTQKLVFIFQARIRVSRKQVQISKTMECVLVVLMLFVQVCIAILSFAVNTSKIIDTYDIERRRHIYECNTSEEFFIQLLFGFLLVLMCMMQAFRARNLPENFNETKYITFAMFLCTITVTVFLPLRFQFDSRKKKTASDAYMLMTFNFILLFVMYGYKCWIIVFQPERNTTSAFKQNISRHVLKEIHPNVHRCVTLATPPASCCSEGTDNRKTIRLSVYD